MVSSSWVMEIVSKADGVTDAEERQIFYQELKKLGQGQDNELVNEIAEEINNNLERVSDDLSRDKRDPVYAILDVRSALDKAPADVGADILSETLFEMGIQIADASGSMTNSGRRIEQAELRALAGLAVLLEVDLEKLEEKDPKIVFQIHGYLKRIENSSM